MPTTTYKFQGTEAPETPATVNPPPPLTPPPPLLKGVSGLPVRFGGGVC